MCNIKGQAKQIAIGTGNRFAAFEVCEDRETMPDADSLAAVLFNARSNIMIQAHDQESF